jgi:hypothetical protein
LEQEVKVGESATFDDGVRVTKLTINLANGALLIVLFAFVFTRAVGVAHHGVFQ